MTDNEYLRKLHDRATRGEALSEDERAQLHAWYEAEDKIENEILQHSPGSGLFDDLRGKTAEALARLTSTWERVKELTAQNESSRQENNHLRQEVAHLLTIDAA